MKVLADSNIFIDFWKKPDQTLIETFTKEDVVICGIVRAELMHGAKTESDFNRICELLSDFEDLPIDDSDWGELGKLLFLLRTRGITVPFQDAVLAMLAVKYDIPLWTRDKHFLYIQLVQESLKLY